jgi:hypothetical protein
VSTDIRIAPQQATMSSATRQLLGGDPRHGPLPLLLLALTAVTGLVDAVSILQLGRVFVANMTGNVVFTGFAIGGAPGFSLSASLFALAGFLVGATVGGMLIGQLGRDRALLLGGGAGTEFCPRRRGLRRSCRGRRAFWAAPPGTSSRRCSPSRWEYRMRSRGGSRFPT